MTHYEQCCARECLGCANKIHIVIEASEERWHDAPPGTKLTLCTAPTLAEFAERCAEALEEVDKLMENLDFYSWATASGKARIIARRALGLEKG